MQNVVTDVIIVLFILLLVVVFLFGAGHIHGIMNAFSVTWDGKTEHNVSIFRFLLVKIRDLDDASRLST